MIKRFHDWTGENSKHNKKNGTAKAEVGKKKKSGKKIQLILVYFNSINTIF